jgi:hypothetical protein
MWGPHREEIREGAGKDGRTKWALLQNGKYSTRISRGRERPTVIIAAAISMCVV